MHLNNTKKTKDLIYETAGRPFRENGYDNVTINKICEACNITKSTFYYHVPSKQDIILNYYDHIIDNLTPLLMQLVGVSSSWEQFLILYDHLRQNIEDLGPNLNSQLLIINLQENRNTFDLRMDLEEIAVNIVKRGQESGEIRNLSDPRQLYEASAYMFTGYQYMWCTLKGNFDWKGKFRRSLEDIFNIELSLRK